MDFELFLALPDGVIDDVLGSWLTVRDIALGLDNALTHHRYRERYLEHLYNAQITLPTTLRIEPRAGDCIGGEDILAACVSDAAAAHRPCARRGTRCSRRGVGLHHCTTRSKKSRSSKTSHGSSGSGKKDAAATAVSSVDEKDVLYWLFHHNLSVETIHFLRNIYEKDLRLIDQKMVDRVREIVLRLFVLTDLDVFCVAACRSLRALSIDCWIGSSLTDAHMETICDNCTQLQSLELVQCQAITRKSVERIRSRLVRLERLTLSLCAGVVFASPTQVFELLGHLQELRADSLFFEDQTRLSALSVSPTLSLASPHAHTSAAPPSPSPPASPPVLLHCALKSLSLPLSVTVAAAALCPLLESVALTVTPAHLMHCATQLREIATWCRSLRRVRFDSVCEDCDLSPFFASLQSSRHCLEEVVIAESLVSPALVDLVVTACPDLRTLELSGPPRRAEHVDDLVEEFDSLDELQHLDSLMDVVRDEDLPMDDETMSPYFAQAQEPNAAMTHASETSIEEQDVGAIASLPMGLERAELRSLSLARIDTLSDAGALRIASLFPQLTSLSLAHCTGISCHSLLQLSRSLCTLRCLTLSGCNVVDDVVLSFLEHNLQLQELDVASCTALTDKVLHEGLVVRANDVRVLNISDALDSFSLDGILELFTARLEQYHFRRPCSVKLERLVLFNGNHTHRLLDMVRAVHSAVGLRDPLIQIEREEIY